MPPHAWERQRDSSPPLATLELARRVDRAEIEFCALAGARGAPGGVASLEVGGGLAVYGKPGSPLNKALGVGLGGPVTDADLGRIEAFYRGRGAPAQVELCPLAAADVAPRLCARGFVVQGFENQLARGMPPGAAPPAGVADVPVTRAAETQTDLWIRVTAEGFAAVEPPPGSAPPGEMPSVETMIDMMSQFAHPEIRRYLASIDGEPAGGGAAWAHHGVLGIFGTATLPKYRRRGVQRAITMAAMAEARDVDLIIATTVPGSTSQRTFERLGFAVLYTRAIFVKA